MLQASDSLPILTDIARLSSSNARHSCIIAHETKMHAVEVLWLHPQALGCENVHSL